MARTQLRLDAVTGSVPALKPASIAKGAAAAAFSADNLQDVLKGYAQALSNIHGSTEFTAQDPGVFEHATSQFIGILSASSDIKGGNDLLLARNLDAAGTGHIGGNFDVATNKFTVNASSGDTAAAGDLTLNKATSVSISAPQGAMKLAPASTYNLVAELGNAASEKVSLTFGGGEKVKFQAAGSWISGSLRVQGLMDAGTVKAENLSATNGALVFHDGTKQLVDDAGLKYDGAALVAPKLQGTNLTPTRVVFVDADKNLIDDSAMTYDSTNDILTVKGSTFSQDVSVARDLTVQGNLNVMGDTVTVNVGELLIEDKIITVASGATGAMLDGAGIQLGVAAEQTFSWNNAGTKWVASAKLASPKLQRTEVTAARIAGYDAAGNLTSEDMNSWVAGTIHQVAVADDGDGSITLSLPQDIHAGATPEFVGAKFSGLSSAPISVDASGNLGEMDLYDWVLGTANQVSIAKSGTDNHGITLSLPQDIHAGASPEFAALNIGTAHDIVNAAGNLKIMTTGELILSGADGQYALAEAGDRAAFVTAFGASETIIGAINALAAGSGGGKGKWVKTFASAPSPDASVADMASAMGSSVFPTDLSRVDVYLNGQMMAATADYAISSGAASVDFTFDLAADDVVVVVIR